jgi:hypothetical protein
MLTYTVFQYNTGNRIYPYLKKNISILFMLKWRDHYTTINDRQG